MANFLEDLSIYNPKAAAAIAEAVLECNNEKANMMSGLKTTANDVTLSDETRLDALTALINLGNLLDIPLPPYFPSTVTYRNTQEYVGIHNNLEGLQGGAPGEYYHLTQAEKEGLLNKASIADITWDNLSGNYSDNEPFALLFDNKQEQLSAPSAGEFYVKINGTTIIYDNTPTIGSITGIVAGGELDGTYPNPTIKNVAVINKVLTGFDGSASTGTILPTDSILTAFQKLNANINNVINNPSGVSSVAFSTTAGGVFTTSSTNTGAVTLSLGLQNQNANLLFASPNAGVGQPSFRALVNADLPNSGVTANTYGSASLIPRITVNSKGIITGVTEVANPSGGQVNSISISAPGFLGGSSVNSIIPATPIINLSFSPQAINQVFAGPASGSSGTPSFRALVEDDIPQLSIDKIDGLDAFTGDFLSDSLGTSLMYIGNGSNKAVQAEVAGDIQAVYNLINTTQTAVLTIKDEAVTYAKFQNIPDSALTVQRPILLGRFDAGQGIMQQMTLSNDFTINTTTGVIGLVTPNPPSLVDVGDLLTSTGSNNLVRLSLPSPNDGYLLMPYAAASNPACGLIWGEVGGDITYTVDDTTTPGTPFGAFSIGANKVTLGKIAQIANNTVLGNVSGNTADVAPLSATQLTTLVEQFNATNGGKVPSPGANFNNNTYFLNAAGGWTTFTSASANNINGGLANQILVQTAPGVTGFITAPSSADTYLKWTGTNFSWTTAGSGSGTVNPGTQYRLAYYATNGAAVSEWNAITGSRALVSDANGLPIASATTVTQIGYLSGATGTTGTNNIVFSTSPTINSPTIGIGAGQGHIHLHTINNNPPSSPTEDYITLFADDNPKTVGVQFGLDIWESYLKFDATQDRTYTFPNATGEVALISAARTLTVSSSGGNAGKIALGGSSSGTITLQAPATVTVSEDLYTLPSAYPLAATGYYLTSDGSGVLSWDEIAAGGDVVGPSGATSGEFAVFSNSSGKLIGEPTNASLSLSGVATFNGGVNIGVAGTATGTLVFGHQSTSATTTFIAPGTPATSAIYIWPTAAGVAGNTLTYGTGGQLSWSAAGTGDLTKAGTNQVVTGDIRFRSTGSALAGLVLRNSAGDFATTFNMSSVGTAATTYITTFQAQSGIVPLLESVNTWTAGNTFNSTASFSSTTAFTGATSFDRVGSATVPAFSISAGTAGTHQWISLGAAAVGGNPTFSPRSAGTRIVLAATATPTSTDAAIGTFQSLTGAQYQNVWISAPQFIEFFPGNLTSNSLPAGRFTNIGLNFPQAFSAANAMLQGLGWIWSEKNGEPSTTARSAGTGIVFGIRSGSIYDSAIGNWQESGGESFNSLWLSAPNRIRFYISSVQNAFVFASTGLTITGTASTAAIVGGAGMTTANVFNAVSTTVNFAGAATALTIGAASGTTTIRNATINLSLATARLQVGGNNVVGPRRTGWAAQTATASKADLGANPTTAQLASFCRALYDDLASAVGHGLIN